MPMMIAPYLFASANDRSLRGRSANSNYMTFTPGAAGNRRKMAFLFAIKPWSLSTSQQTLVGSSAASTHISMDLNQVYLQVGGWGMRSNEVVRDPNAWEFWTVSYDIDNATASQRVRVYRNLTEITSWSADQRSSMSGDMQFGAATAHYIFRSSAGNYADVYMSEFRWINGYTVSPTDWLETDATTGQIVQKTYSPTYGSIGCYLKFDDNSSVAALGTDSSGNGNTWTVSGFSVTAGTANDSLVDSPTNYGTDTGAGGEVRGNYATWDQLAKQGSNAIGTLADGNLKHTGQAATARQTRANFGMSSGKWYWEVTPTNAPVYYLVGISKDGVSTDNYPGADANSYAYRGDTGNKTNGASNSAYGNTYTTNDVIGVAYDADNGKLWFSKNGTWQNSGDPASGTNAAFTGLSGLFFPVVGHDSVVAYGNFGQRPFANAAPSGFKALCTQNLSDPTILKPKTYYDTKVWTPNGGSQTLTGLLFQPDFLWLKRKDNSNSQYWLDVVRGVSKYILSNSANAQATDANFVTGVTSDGWTMGSNNYAAGSAITRAFKEGSGAFDIVTYTGNGTNRTISHSLGRVPKFIIFKNLTNAARDWDCYLEALGAGNYIVLNGAGTSGAGSTRFNSTAPTSSVFSVGTHVHTNESGSDFVAYLFADLPGFLKVGSFTGNAASDGPMVHLGFRPATVMFKRDAAAGWPIIDSSRPGYNSATEGNGSVYANDATAEGFADTGVGDIDILANGIKIRTNHSDVNPSSATVHYIAIAEAPFKYARAR